MILSQEKFFKQNKRSIGPKILQFTPFLLRFEFSSRGTCWTIHLDHRVTDLVLEGTLQVIQSQISWSQDPSHVQKFLRTLPKELLFISVISTSLYHIRNENILVLL